MNKKIFEINWRDEVHRSVEIEAKNKEDAFEKWKSGEWDTNNICETDCDTLSDAAEILENMDEV